MKRRRNAGISIIEFALMLGLLSTVLFTMSTYVKRGVQGRIKEVSDAVINKGISSKQLTMVDKTVSITETMASSEISYSGLPGGSMAVDAEDEQLSNSYAVMTDQATIYTTPLTKGSAGTTPRIDIAQSNSTAATTSSYNPYASANSSYGGDQ